MTLVDILLLLLIAAIVGTIAERLVGYSGGGFLVTIALGFIGAVLGTWLAQRFNLPELLTLDVGGVSFPIIWAIIGAALFVAVISLIARGGRFPWRITPPTRFVLVLSIVLFILALMAAYGNLALPVSAFVLVVFAYLALLLGNLVKGL
jgi:uncharacterized membrane protein YeaQ/YmgE (transglycosylase-associated protein family)